MQTQKNSEIENMPEVSLPTFIKEVAKRGNDGYIRIYPQNNTICAPIQEKTKFGCVTTHIKITLPICINNRGKQNETEVNTIHLHWEKAQTFLSFLMLKPEAITIENWLNCYKLDYIKAHPNDTSLGTNIPANIEQLTFIGRRKKQYFQISISNFHWSHVHRMCRRDI